MNHLFAPFVCALLLSTAPAQGQASGFHDGELIYYSQGVPGLPTQAGILRIDPATGTTSLLFNLWSALSRQDAIAGSCTTTRRGPALRVARKRERPVAKRSGRASSGRRRASFDWVPRCATVPRSARKTRPQDNGFRS